jgi:hypothetical protein
VTLLRVNRVLRQLRELGLVTLRDGEVVFHDFIGLRRLAEHHGSYLDQAASLLG